MKANFCLKYITTTKYTDRDSIQVMVKELRGDNLQFNSYFNTAVLNNYKYKIINI